MLKWFRDTFMPSYHELYKTEHAGVEIINTSYGFITYRIDKTTDTACVMELYIAPKYRGQGYSVKLLEQVKEIAERNEIGTFMSVIDPMDSGSLSAVKALETVGMKKFNQKLKLEMELYTRRTS